MTAAPTPDPSSAWYVLIPLVPGVSWLRARRGSTHFPLAPKMSTSPSAILSGNLGYFWRTSGLRGGRGKAHVVETAVGRDAAALLQVALFAHDGGDAARREPCRTGPNQTGETLEKLSLCDRRVERVKVVEETSHREQLVREVAAQVSHAEREGVRTLR